MGDGRLACPWCVRAVVVPLFLTKTIPTLPYIYHHRHHHHHHHHRSEADRRGLTLDRESFETALGAVASAKQPARARDLLKAMREAGAGIPDRGVVAALIEMCRELDEAALAEELARDFGPIP